MKTKKTALFALALFIAAISIASDFPKMNVLALENEKALVAFKSETATPLEVTLTNQDGEILYFKHTEKRYTDYRKIFDFSELGPGNYSVCVNFGNRSINRNVDVTKDGIEVGPPERLFEPYFCLNGKQLNVSLYNCPQKQVFLNIYKEGQHISGVKLGKDLALQKCIDLSKLKAGEYEVVLTDCYKDHKFIARL